MSKKNTGNTGNTGNKPHNFVHKHGMEFNHSVVHDDRKRRSKNGYEKHKTSKTSKTSKGNNCSNDTDNPRYGD